MTTPVAYTAFHLNLAFSSIEERQRSTVIERCYWPLLKLAEKGFPIGLEATSYTLNEINRLDPKWIETCASLIANGVLEFIASGYTQMIAPLVPRDVTRRNLDYGNKDYQALLGIQPRIALINEQAYSAGLLPLYKEAGFEAVMMDWSESASHSPDWDISLTKGPQILLGEAGVTMPVVWSDAISFQKLQRYAHGEIEADEYLEFLTLKLESGSAAFPLYSSDAEVFDYRPGRFGSEAKLAELSEYQRMELLFNVIERSGVVRLGTPSEALAELDHGAKPISLETAAVPVPVKKQRKYNVLRWAVTGRADLSLNTFCWRAYRDLAANGNATEAGWRQLCRWWASDLRTHIVPSRWEKVVNEIGSHTLCCQPASTKPLTENDGPKAVIREEGRYIIVEGDDFHISFNMRRGMAIQSMGFGKHEPAVAGGPHANGLIGTLAHGFYDTIEFGADFYTGHYVSEPADRHKMADLVPCQADITQVDGLVELKAALQVGEQRIQKTMAVDLLARAVTVSYEPPIDLPFDGSARFGHVTLNPRSFDAESLYFSCQNGGQAREKFSLWNNGLLAVDHGGSVSRLVSATTGLGLTDGMLELGDSKQFVRLYCDRLDVAACGMVTATLVGNSFFARAALTLAESDETRKASTHEVLTEIAPIKLRYRIEVGQHPAAKTN